jgi:O-antigen ligase
VNEAVADTHNRVFSARAKRIEQVLVVTLGAFALSAFFSQTGINSFGLLSLLLLLILKIHTRFTRKDYLPRPLAVWTIIMLVNMAISAVIVSDHRLRGLVELKRQWAIFLGGLLVISPLSDQSRKKIIYVFFAGAVLAGVVGVFQHFGILLKHVDRSHAFAHPIHYAETLSFSGAIALMLLLIPNDVLPRNRKVTFLLLLTVLASFTGVLFSLTRGVWISLAAACPLILFLYRPRKALIFTLSALAVLLVIFVQSKELRTRATSIYTSLYTEGPYGSTGSRFVLWKASLLMFEGSPLVGEGVGDFDDDVNKLIAQKEIAPISVTCHAHNIFFQALATQGLVGLVILCVVLAQLFRWGMKMLKAGRPINGYLILLVTLLTVLEGLTEYNLGVSKFLAVFMFSLGLFGGYGVATPENPIRTEIRRG